MVRRVQHLIPAHVHWAFYFFSLFSLFCSVPGIQSVVQYCNRFESKVCRVFFFTGFDCSSEWYGWGWVWFLSSHFWFHFWVWFHFFILYCWCLHDQRWLRRWEDACQTVMGERTRTKLIIYSLFSLKFCIIFPVWGFCSVGVTMLTVSLFPGNIKKTQPPVQGVIDDLKLFYFAQYIQFLHRELWLTDNPRTFFNKSQCHEW